MKSIVAKWRKAAAALAPLALLLLSAFCGRSETWQEALAPMPLGTNVMELDRSNCVPLLLRALKPNETVKALVFMPGATDEFYFFRRARARLTNDSPTLLDAITALTNQTYITTRFLPPFLLLHSVEDPPVPILQVEDPKLAGRLRQKAFKKKLLYLDRQWDSVVPDLTFYLNRRILPVQGSRESFHFYRHSLAGYNLTAWEALEALSLADKTTITLKKRAVVFQGDTRQGGKPRLDHMPYGGSMESK